MPTRRVGRPYPSDARNEVSDLVMEAQAHLMTACDQLREAQQKLFQGQALNQPAPANQAGTAA